MRTSDEKKSLIWKSFLAGDQEAFAHLYNQHVDSMYRYGTKICKDEDLVKDAIQEVFIDLYVKRHKNRTDPGHLKYYLILALKRNLIKKLKRNRRLVDETEGEDQFEPEYSIETILIESEMEEALNRRLAEAGKSFHSAGNGSHRRADRLCLFIQRRDL
jgi:RNA polymerase sigma factor (sigma-70 family)